MNIAEENTRTDSRVNSVIEQMKIYPTGDAESAFERQVEETATSVV